MANEYKYELKYVDNNGKLTAFVKPNVTIANVSALEAFYDNKTMGEFNKNITGYLRDTVCPELGKIAGLKDDALTAAITASGVDKTVNYADDMTEKRNINTNSILRFNLRDFLSEISKNNNKIDLSKFVITFNLKDDNPSDGLNTNVTQTSSDNKTAKSIIADAIESSAKKCVIFTGAPGTGKTFCVEKYVTDEMKEKGFDKSKYFVQFHSSYDYSDFVEGLRPIQKGNDDMVFVRMDGIFKAFCRKVAENNAEYISTLSEDVDEKDLDNYYFVIDEINRADLGRVFGELMYCFEKRGDKHRIATQYQNLPAYDKDGNPIEKEKDCFKDGFYIPENVVIIGTMNDIDRSVETFDFALRRRFDWVNIDADDVMESSLEAMMDDIKPETLKQLVERITNLNKVIKMQTGLGAEFKIGPAYFKDYNGENDEYIWQHNVEPILREYMRGRQDEIDFIDKCKAALLPEQASQTSNTNAPARAETNDSAE